MFGDFGLKSMRKKQCALILLKQRANFIKFFTTLVWLLLSSLSVKTFASTITSSDSRISVISQTTLPSDVVNIAPANSAGISINRFARFDINTKPLVLQANANNPVNTQVKTIVIVADNMTINQKIKWLGAVADIVFVSENRSGEIRCVNCNLENFHHITMLVNDGSATLQESELLLGQFESSPLGRVELQNVKASGVLSLKALAGVINTSGTINLNERGNRTASGSYSQSDTGSITIGSGSLDLMAGDILWDYDTQTLVGYSLTTSASTVSGTISAKALRVSLTGPTTFSAKTDTRTTLLASIRYNGQAKIVEEAVQIVNYSQTNLSFSAASSINSSGNVVIDSVSGINLPLGATIFAKEAKIIAGHRFTNNGGISAERIDIGVGSLINEGILKATGALNVWADTLLLNRYGGEILAKDLLIKSNPESGMIVNGSRTPWRSTPDAPLYIDANYLSRVNPTKLGTFYTAGLDALSSYSGLTMPEKSSAQIRARNITIEAAYFENINPYYEKADAVTRLVELDRVRQSQVAVVAENMLKAKAAKYLLNSSALLGAELANAFVHLESAVVLNERYRIFSALERVEDIAIEGISESESYFTQVVAYSPPGLIFSISNFQATALGLFLNSVGYFEVFGNATVQTQNFVERGLAQSGIRENTVLNWNLCFYSYICDETTSTTVAINPNSADSLLFVNGNFQASDTDADLGEYNAFYGYIDIAVENLKESTYSFVFEDITTEYNEEQLLNRYTSQNNDPTYYDVANFSTDNSFDYHINEQTGEIIIDWERSATWTVNGYGTSPYGHPINTTSTNGRSASDTDSYSIFDQIVWVYYQVRDAISAFFNEISWWN